MDRKPLINEDSVDRLIEMVIERVNAPENQAKKLLSFPKYDMSMEEGIAFSKIFGFNFNRCLENPDFNVRQQLRNRLFCMDNLGGSSAFISDIPSYPGYYFEYSFFGIRVGYTAEGVPTLQDDHPVTREPAISLVPKFDFKSSGLLPLIRSSYERQRNVVGNRIKLVFPTFVRGCLDIAIQLRGYENWITDTLERPQFVHDLMQLIVDYRITSTEATYAYLGEPVPESVTLADDWVNIPFITPAMFDDFVLPYYQQLADHYGKITNFHTCGCQNQIIDSLKGIHGLQSFEVSPWTSLDLILEKVPAEMPLTIALHSNKHVLLPSPEEIRAHLYEILTKTVGRKITVLAGGLQPIHEDYNRDISRIREFAAIAHEVFSEFKTRVTE